MPATPLWLAAAEAMLNRNIDTSGLAADAAARLEGKSLQIDAHSLARLRARVVSGHLLLAAGDDSPADAVISGSPRSLIRLFTAANSVPASSSVPATSSAPATAANAQIRGDAEVANQFRELLKRVRPDFEEELSRLIGVVPARGFATAAARVVAWGRHAAATARANVAEYLQEENRALVNKTELEEYLRGVDGVRETVDRADARLRALERRSSGLE